ncbi:hypothetical protein JXA80_05720, partial [bacterium]|nr:hypothetical protein [candidate division CSSED10-310 bacterium]
MADVRILPGFPVIRLRFRYQAQVPGHLPWQCGAIIRGTLGRAMREVYCVVRDGECGYCGCREQCPYAMFWSEENRIPGGFFDRYRAYPRSYIIEPPLTGLRLEPGDAFEFNLILMGHGVNSVRAWVAAARRAGELGFGRDRIGMALREV